jgi:nucleoside-diphosphate-sugar epimerase
MLEGKPVIVHGDGSTLWTVTHNSDFAKGFAGLMANPHAIGQAVHLTGDECLTWNQIHGIIAARLGVKLNVVYVSSHMLAHAGKPYGYDFEGALTGDKAITAIFDNAKLKRLVPGFAATKRFDQGMAETLPYIMSHPELQLEDPAFDEFTEKVIAAIKRAYSDLA